VATNYESAFSLAFTMLNNSIAVENTANCPNGRVILFLTDGLITQGLSDQPLYDLIAKLNAPYNLTIFTYGLGSEATGATAAATLKEIACANNGIWTPISDTGLTLIQEMSSYYQYFAALNAGQQQVVWVEPYIDDSGAGNLTTASIAVYDDTVYPPVHLGVIGVDLKLEDMVAVQPDYSLLFEFLTKKTKKMLNDCI